MIRSCFYTYPYHLRCSCLKNKSFVSSVSENGKKIVALQPEVTKRVYFIGNERMLIAHDSNRLRFS